MGDLSRLSNQGAFVHLLDQLYALGLIVDDGRRDSYTGSMDRLSREALYTAANSIAKSRDEKPGIGWFRPYSDQNMAKVTAYINGVLNTVKDNAVPPVNPVGIDSPVVAATHFRHMVSIATDQPGSPINVR